MIISVVFVSMMVVFVTVYYFVAKPKKQQEKIYSAMTTDELIRFVQSMHCELQCSGSSTFCLMLFACQIALRTARLHTHIH